MGDSDLLMEGNVIYVQMNCPKKMVHLSPQRNHKTRACYKMDWVFNNTKRSIIINASHLDDPKSYSKNPP